MKIIGVIPARYGSTRFPGKALADIGGKPMIQRVWESASKSKLINELYTATDDKRIFDAVGKFWGKSVITSAKHKSGSDRIGEVVKNIKCDIVVNIQGDEPFIKPSQIDLLMDCFNSEDVKIDKDNATVRLFSKAMSYCNNARLVMDKYSNTARKPL